MGVSSLPLPLMPLGSNLRSSGLGAEPAHQPKNHIQNVEGWKNYVSIFCLMKKRNSSFEELTIQWEEPGAVN